MGEAKRRAQARKGAVVRTRSDDVYDLRSQIVDMLNANLRRFTSDLVASAAVAAAAGYSIFVLNLHEESISDDGIDRCTRLFADSLRCSRSKQTHAARQHARVKFPDPAAEDEAHCALVNDIIGLLNDEYGRVCKTAVEQKSCQHGLVMEAVIHAAASFSVFNLQNGCADNIDERDTEYVIQRFADRMRWCREQRP